ncbi:aminotransferase class I/II-fold pyridoxal phosphate-dependent enzyme [Flavivirga amylovorans]|uniref:Aminotransferase n=1 Tax=Flavivirga amylovorans TaxID=870486 RepID=A0ABT8X0N0_9FLAO|nr:aminotransferase class I/II-fold pyridoxal phosphate-dependent enzyme [Flavivirga amylovorans]MDO5987432.1 aminotransferase class I/II-fold pyridoxal phosphate-dependent enzyme [Flavivirga amylovorans]
MIEAANRLQTVEEYYFSKKLREVNFLITSGKPIINLGIGSPDLQPPQKVVEAIKEGLLASNAHKYQSYQGLPELREAIAEFYKEHFSVSLSATTEVLPLMGSKEGIMHISMAYLNEGDAVLIPNPGYPTYQSVTKLVGAKPVFYELDAANNWLPDFEALEQLDLSKVKLMWVNYPNMPTGAQPNTYLFEELVAFAKRHNILIVNDNPYSFILNESPKSILSIEGAKDVCLELNSLSKTFNMAGWRVGMVLGDSKHINNILKVKSNMDSGMFYGIQKGAIEALKCSEMWFVTLNSVYKQRRDLVWKLADALNCTYDKNATGLFVWAKLPDSVKAEAYIDSVLKDKHIFITPGTIFGSKGEGYIRFSLCATNEVLEEAIKRVE